jgi:uncharacterized protein YybS (DUF2232 family)
MLAVAAPTPTFLNFCYHLQYTQRRTPPSTVRLDMSPSPKPNSRAKPPIDLVETAFLASTTVTIWLFNYYLPIGPIFRMFLPLPIALVYLRRGARAGWMCAAVTTLLLSVIMGPTRSILFAIPYAILSPQLGNSWRRNHPWSISVLLAATIDAIGIFFRFLITSILIGEDLWTYSVSRARDIIDAILAFFGIVTEPTFIAVQLATIGLVFLSSLTYAFAVHLIASLLFDRLGNPIPTPPRWVADLFEL